MDMIRHQAKYLKATIKINFDNFHVDFAIDCIRSACPIVGAGRDHHTRHRNITQGYLLIFNTGKLV